MQAVVLVAFLFNIMTGEIGPGMTPITFESVAVCEKYVKDNETQAPMGMKWYHKCINPSTISI